MKTYHDKLVDKVSEYIRRVHSDQSVSLERTLDSLEMLRDKIDDCIVAIREDINANMAD